MLILGIDPGNARCGWGVVRKEGSRTAFVACGCIETQKGEDEAVRLRQVAEGLSRVIENHKPNEAAVESIFLFKNPRTVITVAEARGVVLATLAATGIPAFTYTPLQVKQALTSYGRAEKGQVVNMVVRLLGLSEVPKPDDAADALAIALCHSAVPEALKSATSKGTGEVAKSGRGR